MAAGRSSASLPLVSRRVRWPTELALVCLLAVAMPLAAASETADVTAATAAASDPGIARAWRVLRQVDCARCHGRSYDGLAAPSIVAYAATQTPAQFDRMVIDGDPSRGMPGYRSNAFVVESLDDIRRYFTGRANGNIGADYRPPAPTRDR